MNHSIKAVASILFSQLAMSSAQLITKIVNLTVPQVMLYRGIFIVVFNYLWRQVLLKEKLIFYPAKNNILHNLSGTFIMSLANQMNFIAQRSIPLGISNIIFQLQILWCQFFSFLLYGKTLSMIRIRNILISFVGIILIAKPEFIFSNEMQQYSILGISIALIGSVLEAIGNTLCSYQKKVNFKVQIHYLHFSHIIWGSLINFYVTTSDQSIYEVRNFGQLVFLSLLTYVSNFYYFMALQLEKSERIAPAMVINPVYGFVFDLVFLKTVPDGFSIIGVVIILLATFSTVLENMR